MFSAVNGNISCRGKEGSKAQVACYFGGAANHMMKGCPILVSRQSTEGWHQTKSLLETQKQ